MYATGTHMRAACGVTSVVLFGGIAVANASAAKGRIQVIRIYQYYHTQRYGV